MKIFSCYLVQVYKAMRRHVQECAVKVLKCINDDELLSFQRVHYFSALLSPPARVCPGLEGCNIFDIKVLLK